MNVDKIEIQFIQSIRAVNRNEWKKVVNTDYPFIQYDFLLALEQSGATCAETGWLPRHLVMMADQQVVGVMPLFIKTHSYGEYVFDFQWANAFHKIGVDYYPKLISAIPFTPARGKRIYLLKEFESSLNQSLITKQLGDFVANHNLSSWHILFPTQTECLRYQSTDCLERHGVQYHWLNKGYTDFEHYLSALKIKPRKNIRRERLHLYQQGVDIKWINGNNISGSMWHQFYQFYRNTYLRKSGHDGYLSEAFFKLIGQTMADSILMATAEISGKIVAAALFFKDSSTLYGRYWGTHSRAPNLHFELCYYQGIEYCIQHGLQRFDAGAQGEHKIKRGFEAIKTYSLHWIKHPDFRLAIENFVTQESRYIAQAIDTINSNLPFK